MSPWFSFSRPTVQAQSLEQRLDHDVFLDGLAAYALPEVLDHYIATHPPADTVRAARYQITSLRLRLSERGLPASERDQLLSQITALRDQLILDNPNDPRRIAWMIDQAADLYLLDLPTDGSGITSLLGLPTAAQRERASRVVHRMIKLLDEAELAAEEAIMDIESLPGFRDDLALQSQRRQMDEQERQRRLPFLRGVAACLHARLNHPPDRDELLELAAESLADVPDRLSGQLAAQARLFHALALAELGRFDAAEELLRDVATAADADTTDVLSARLIGVINRTIRGGERAGLEALESVAAKYGPGSDLFHRLLLADHRFVLQRRLVDQAADAADREARWREALSGYLALMNDVPAADRAAVRAAVFVKLIAATDDSTPLAALPPIVTVARASGLARDEAGAGAGLAMLEKLLARTDLDAPTRAQALFAAGRAAWTARKTSAAMACFVQFARDYPTEPEAERAIELAASIGAGEHARVSGDPKVRAELAQILALLLERYPSVPDVDQWRLLAARLALTDQDPQRVQRVLREVAPGSVHWAEAQALLAQAAWSISDSVQDPQTRQRSMQLLITHLAELRRGLETSSAAANSRAAAHAAQIRLIEAQALLAAQQPAQAMAVLDSLERQGALSGPMLGESLRLRLAASRAARRSQDLVHELRRFLDASPSQAALVVSDLLASINAEVQDLQFQMRPDQARRKIDEELAPLALIAHDWLAAAPAASAQLQGVLAQSLRLAARCDLARGYYDRLIAQNPDAADLLAGQAECLYQSGDDDLAAAMTIYRRLIAGTGPDDRLHWLSQLRSLQILDATGRNTAQIVPRIRQLRLQDPQLGGEFFRQQFDALQNKHGTSR